MKIHNLVKLPLTLAASVIFASGICQASYERGVTCKERGKPILEMSFDFEQGNLYLNDLIGAGTPMSGPKAIYETDYTKAFPRISFIQRNQMHIYELILSEDRRDRVIHYVESGAPSTNGHSQLIRVKTFFDCQIEENLLENFYDL